MTDVKITPLAAAPLHALEIWGNAKAVATRFKKALGFALPAKGQSATGAQIVVMRFEPNVWLVEGDVTALADILGKDGALTAIGGGIERIRLSGPAWRALLMEGGVFDAEDPAFGPGATAATVIDHVNVRLHVIADDICEAYVPASFSAALLHFWKEAAPSLAL
ncbi:MAG: hypothetical protein ACKOXK_04140 [Chakrabartia sp.]